MCNPTKTAWKTRRYYTPFQCGIQHELHGKHAGITHHSSVQPSRNCTGNTRVLFTPFQCGIQHELHGKHAGILHHSSVESSKNCMGNMRVLFTTPVSNPAGTSRETREYSTPLQCGIQHELHRKHTGIIHHSSVQPSTNCTGNTRVIYTTPVSNPARTVRETRGYYSHHSSVQPSRNCTGNTRVLYTTPAVWNPAGTVQKTRGYYTPPVWNPAGTAWETHGYSTPPVWNPAGNCMGNTRILYTTPVWNPA